MSDQRAGYLRFRRKLVLGYLALCALLAALLLWKIASDYHLSRESAAMVARNGARAMAAHVQELIEAVDQPLRTSAAGIGTLAGKKLAAESVRPLLASSSLGSDARFWLMFIDAQGEGMVASNGVSVEGVSFLDRAYFRDAMARANGLSVGIPAVEPSTNRRVFFLSRRVESASGKILGVVAAAVDAWRVAEVFERARLGPDMSIALATMDNVVVAKAPLFEQSFGADFSNLPVAIPPERRFGEFDSASPLNGERHHFAYAPVGSLPLRVVVGFARESWLAHFRSDFSAGVAGLAVALSVAFFSGRLALEQFQRLERVEEWQRKLIDQLGRAKAELTRSERRVRAIADHLPARVAYVNVDERYTFHNAGGLGAPLGAVLGKTLLETHGAATYGQLREGVHRALAGESVSFELIGSERGAPRHFKHQYAPDRDAQGRVIGFYALVTDITEFKMIQRRLAAVARADPLTGLPNRAALLDRLDDALARRRRSGAELACLYLDIDRFKAINDTLGHLGGDCALVEFGRRLRQCVRECDMVARLAGDEFVIVLEGLGSPAEAAQVAAKIIASMAEPFNIEGTRWPVTASVGVVAAEPSEDDSRSLLRAADKALYLAKRSGRNRAEIREAGH